MPRSWATAEVSDPTVDYSDIKGDDVELWLIRCPTGFDASQLHGKAVTTGESLGSSSNASSARFELRDIPACESEGLVSAFPSNAKQKWLLAKPFTRQLTVCRVPEPRITPEPGLPLPPVPQLKGLRLRQSFFGPQLPSSAPTTARGDVSTQVRKRKQMDDIEDSAVQDAQDRKHRKAAKAAKKAAKAAKQQPHPAG